MNTKLLLTIAHFILGLVALAAQNGANDPSFNPMDNGSNSGEGANNAVRTTAIQSDGRIIIGGIFTSFDGTETNRIARLNIEGTLDTSFNSGTGASGSGSVSSMSIQSDGKIIIGGGFTTYNGIAINRIARLNTDGSLDASFNPGLGASGIVYTISIQSDGKIIIGGNFTSYNGTARNRIARLNTDGSLDASFNPGSGANDIVYSISIQSDGKIIVGGWFTTFSSELKGRIVRLHEDGSLDTSFNEGTGGAGGSIFTTSLQSDGRIIIGGSFFTYKGTDVTRIARLNTDGTIDTTFNTGTGADNTVINTTIQSDGKIIITGNFISFNDIDVNRIARLNSDGTLDTSFILGTNANNWIRNSSIQSDGKIIIGGDFITYNDIQKNRVARLNSDGSLDVSFLAGTGANNAVRTTFIQNDEKIIIAGNFTTYNGAIQSRIARLDTNGFVDTTFNSGTGANNTVRTTSLQSDGKIIFGGDFTFFNGVSRNRIARLNADGTLDPFFNPGAGPDFTIRATAIQNSGKIIIGGDFTLFDNVNIVTRLARLNVDGSLDWTFNTVVGANGSVLSIINQSDGKIIIGGSFTSYAGASRNHIARLNTHGSLDNTFNPGAGANGSVMSILAQGDGKIVIGGDFTTFNGTGRNGIARLNIDGTLDASFNPGIGANGSVNSMSIQSDGKIIIGGNFTAYNGIAISRIARLNTDGSLDVSFDSGSGANGTVLTTSLQSDGKVIIGGFFTAYDGIGRNRIARIINCNPASGAHTVDACISFTWIDGNIYTMNNNTATHYIANGAADGCDSLVTLDLTIHTVDTSVIALGNTLTANAEGESFQWLDCDNNYALIAGATSQTYTPTATGNYAVAVTQNSCTDTSFCFNVTLTETFTVSSNNELVIYPNPFSSQTVVQTDYVLHNAVLTIDNVYGQTVAQMRNISGKTITLSRDHLASGLHILRLTQGNQLIAIKKIVITD